MQFLTYKTTLDIMHRLSDRDGLVDKSCTDVHTHENCVLVIGISTSEIFLDYKTIKRVVTSIIDNGTSKNGWFDVNEILSDAITENLVKYFKQSIREQLMEIYGSRTIYVNLQETEKYGVLDLP